MDLNAKRWYYLLNEEFRRLLKPLLLVCAFNAIGQLVLIYLTSRNDASVADRYESFYIRSGAAILFFVGLAGTAALFALHFYKHYWGSKSIYTLMTLPIKRSGVYFTQLLSFTLGLALFLLLSILTTAAGYEIFISAQKQLSYGQYVMNHGLFLAFVRSDFLRLLVPLTWKSLFSSCVLWISFPIIILFTVISERSLRFRNMALSGLTLILMILSVTLKASYVTDYIITIALALLNLFLIGMSLKIIDRNGITG